MAITRPPQLRDSVRRSAENRPGVYRFIGPRDEVLYVGKSIRIRTRLLSYFRKGGKKEAELLRVTRHIDWEYLPHELEALVRELRLIRAFRPRFNVRHRRERAFAWVRLTPGPAPRLVATRSPAPDGSRFFGPFPAPRDLPARLRELSHTVGLRDCPQNTPIHFADQLDLLAPAHSPGCLRAETGSCPGPCAALCTEGTYHKRVEETIAFLEGRSNRPLDRIEDRMSRAAKDQEFELASRFRDRLERVRWLRDQILEFSAHLSRLNFLYSPILSEEDQGPAAPEAKETRGSPIQEGHLEPGHTRRSYLIRGGRLRMVLPQGMPDSSSWQNPKAQKLLRILDEAPPRPEELTTAQREELFLVTRWFRERPKELEWTRPLPSPSPGGSCPEDTTVR